jgi:uncharacterized protein with ATP-grasp and redox domains
VASPPIAQKQSVLTPEQLEQMGQSVWATNVNSLSLDKMLRAVVMVVQKMTESNDAVLEEAKIMAITKIVLNLVEQNGHS